MMSNETTRFQDEEEVITTNIIVHIIPLTGSEYRSENFDLSEMHRCMYISNKQRKCPNGTFPSNNFSERHDDKIILTQVSHP